MIRARTTRMADALILETDVHRDARGFFAETWRLDEVRAAGILEPFVQENHSRSVRDTLRGLHFQEGHRQGKLVRVGRGAIWDVIVDLRPGSASLGEWEGFTLDDVDLRQLYVPPGFAHGFCVVSDTADVLYRVSAYYDSSLERGLAWDDPELAIPWPSDSPLLSERDRKNPPLSEIVPVSLRSSGSTPTDSSVVS